ncbi:hypothetical protein N7582_000068 [Saccharomyces uvarum]|nr:hypothetical protein N7582_000068 [Saccharomyces uvarum]
MTLAGLKPRRTDVNVTQKVNFRQEVINVCLILILSGTAVCSSLMFLRAIKIIRPITIRHVVEVSANTCLILVTFGIACSLLSFSRPIKTTRPITIRRVVGGWTTWLCRLSWVRVTVASAIIASVGVLAAGNVIYVSACGSTLTNAVHLTRDASSQNDLASCVKAGAALPIATFAGTSVAVYIWSSDWLDL